MYIRGLIPRNFTDFAEVVPIELSIEYTAKMLSCYADVQTSLSLSFLCTWHVVGFSMYWLI